MDEILFFFSRNISSSTLPSASCSLFTVIFQTPLVSFFHPTVLSTAFSSYLPHFFDGVFILIHQEQRGPATARPELPPFHKAAAVLTERSVADLPNIWVHTVSQQGAQITGLTPPLNASNSYSLLSLTRLRRRGSAIKALHDSCFHFHP